MLWMTYTFFQNIFLKILARFFLEEKSPEEAYEGKAHD